jgi:hypothetical protein
MKCPDCSVIPGARHGMGCSWELCPYCSSHLWDCEHEPTPEERLPWLPCGADDPDGVPLAG